MGLRPLYAALKARLLAVMRSRAIKTLIFSGSPVITRIRLDRNDEGQVWTLIYKNGLMLTLGETGILDYQDRGFSEFMEGGEGPNDREFLEQLHKIVLQSLLRYITSPRLEIRQRERAAEAASKLWLATERRPGTAAGTTAGAPGPVSVDAASWTPGSPREPIRR